MGISGLLGLLKSIQKPCNLKAFAGQTIGIDAYGWLHRAAASCVIELAQNKPTTKLVDFAMHRVRMLLHFGVTPYLIFDGDHLPSKANVEQSRAQRRHTSRMAGLELLRLGKPAQAHQELQKAVDITPELARQLIEELKRNNIQYVVAPYEADAQMVYLEREGFIDAILSEDSDLLVFGAKCLLTKLDQYGDCVMIRQQDFTACRDVNLVGWTCSDFRCMAILSGCDYLGGIHKMGLRTAHRLIRKHKTIDRIVRAAQLDGKFQIPCGYLESFAQAEKTFLYQWVYCPRLQQLVNLTTVDSNDALAQLTYLGACVEPRLAKLVAAGDIHPSTKCSLTLKSTHKVVHGTPLNQKIKTTPDSTKCKPIDQFFQRTRTPLAELNPNAFTASPSQQRILQQNVNQCWYSDGASRNPLSVASNKQAMATSKISSATLSSTMNPLKRPCLYVETMGERVEQSMSVPAAERSRFFTSGSYDCNPLPRHRAACKKSKTAEITIWSDDSIEDAMAALPDLSDSSKSSIVTTAKPNTTMSPYSSAKNKGLTVTGEQFQATPLVEWKTLDCYLAPGSNINNTPLFHIRNSEPGCSSVESQSQSQRQRTDPCQTTTASVVPPTEPTTPLNDHRTSEASCYRVDVNSDYTHAVSDTPDATSRRPYQNLEAPAIRPSRVNLPKRRRSSSLLAGRMHTWRNSYCSAKGSEDLLLVVPDSDGDLESASDLDRTKSPTHLTESNHVFDTDFDPVTRLDLKRFVFTGVNQG